MNASQTIVIFICRDCGATFGAHEVTVPDTEARLDEKVSIDENMCPDCRGILDVRFSESPPAEEQSAVVTASGPRTPRRRPCRNSRP